MIFSTLALTSIVTGLHVYFVSVLSLIPRLEDTLVKDMDSNYKSWFVLDIAAGKKTNNDIRFIGLPTNTSFLSVYYISFIVTII